MLSGSTLFTNVIVEGDSFSSHATETWARYFSNRCATLGWTFKTNASIGGDTVSNIVLSTTNELGPWMPTNTSTSTLLILDAAYNDFKTGDSADTIWVNTSNILSFARSSGAKTMLFTVAESALYTPATLTKIADYNALCRRWATNADYLVEKDLIFGNPNFPILTLDSTHWTNTVNELLAQEVEWTLTHGAKHRRFLPPRTIVGAVAVAPASNAPPLIATGRTGQHTNLAEFSIGNTRMATVSSNGGFRATKGSAVIPAFSFESETGTGWDSLAANAVSFVTGASERARLVSISGGALVAVQTSGANPAIRFGTTVTTDDCGIWCGTGSPEGVVTAKVGSIWLRKDGGAATSFYVKESGTGNTGWVGK